jgi:hypothetical protein
MATVIIEREMIELRKDNPDFDPEKLQEMLYGGNPEMKELALVTLEGKTKYTGKLLREILGGRYGDWIVTDYINNNKLNITGRIR